MGVYSAVINGFFEPTQEKGGDGRVIYAKRDEPSVCIEHFGGHWQVKLMSERGTANCFAEEYVGSDCAIEACTSYRWVDYDENDVLCNPSSFFEIATGEEAERQVRGSCRRARQNELPPLPHFALSVIVNSFV